MAYVFDPDPAQLKRKLETDFDFRAVTRELLAENDNSSAGDPRAETTGLTFREARKLVRTLELAAFGRRSRGQTRGASQCIKTDPCKLQELARSYADTAQRKHLHRRFSEAVEYQQLAAEVYAEARSLLGLTRPMLPRKSQGTARPVDHVGTLRRRPATLPSRPYVPA